MEINFREINKENYNECLELKVGEHQVNYVAPNAYSLVQAAYEENLYPLGIYDKDKMIGFILYDYDEELEGWSFSRFMIDMEYQNKGFGKASIEKFLELFHKKFPEEKIYTSVEIDNRVAMKLYEKQGFIKGERFSYSHNGVTYNEFRMLKEKW